MHIIIIISIIIIIIAVDFHVTGDIG